MKIDLHLHTTASDGTDTPSEVVRIAFEKGFEAIAVTDHDSMNGVEEAAQAASALGMKMIPGVEISATGEREVHVLGYGMTRCEILEGHLARMREQRSERMRQMVYRLNRIGVGITLKQATRGATGAVGRSHLARALVFRGDARDVRDAFNRYLAPGRPAFVPREKLSVEDAIQMIREAGGISVIAHPGQERSDGYWSRERLQPLIAAGLAGLECYHPSHNAQQSADLVNTCRELGLLVTGGSDYHGAIKQVGIGDGMERWATLDDDYMRFLHRL